MIYLAKARHLKKEPPHLSVPKSVSNKQTLQLQRKQLDSLTASIKVHSYR